MNHVNTFNLRTFLSCSFFCLFMTLSSDSRSQNFLQPGNEWIYEYNTYAFGIGIVSQTIEKITIGTDTVINNQTYTRVLASQEDPCRIYLEVEYLREEGDQVYRIGPDGQSEYKMIDFTDSVGYEMYFESITNHGNIDTALTIIDSFGTEYTYDGTLVDVQYMRILNNQSFDDETVYKVYKNIGFVQYGLLFPGLGTGLCDVFEGTVLRCHISETDTIHFTEFDCFESSLPSATENPSWNRIALFPNPAFSEVYIPSEFEVQGIYGIDGIPRAFSQFGSTLNIANLVPGVYFVTLTGGESEIFYGKIMKM